MNDYDYSPPVDQLLVYGNGRGSPWPNYLELGFTKADVPELIRVVLNSEQHWLNDEETMSGWAPIHAWRALGQLQAEEAAKPMLDVLDQCLGYGWVLEEFPVVFGMIGPGIIPLLWDYWREPLHQFSSYVAVIVAFEKIGNQHRNARDQCVAVLVKALEKHRENDATLNGFIISSLIDLRAIEIAPLITQAFNAESVAKDVAGDLHDVLYELGIGPKPPPKPPTPLALLVEAWLERHKKLEEAEEHQKRRGEQAELDILEDDSSADPASFSQSRHQKKRKSSQQAKKKAKRKMQKKARKRSRRR